MQRLAPNSPPYLAAALVGHDINAGEECGCLKWLGSCIIEFVCMADWKIVLDTVKPCQRTWILLPNRSTVLQRRP